MIDPVPFPNHTPIGVAEFPSVDPDFDRVRPSDLGPIDIDDYRPWTAPLKWREPK